MARSNENYYERKQELTIYALELFLEKTYEQTTTRDVMEKAGISQGALYHYFTSKEDMLNEVMLYLTKQANKKFDWIYSIKMTADTKLLRFIQESIEYMNFSETIQINRHLNENKNSIFFYRTLVNSQMLVSSLLEQIIKQGVEESIFSTETPSLDSVTIQSLFCAINLSTDSNVLNCEIKKICHIIQQCLNSYEEFTNSIESVLTSSIAKIRSLNDKKSN